MIELEIIEYLKQNKEKGIIYDFMPADVREWCMTHQNEQIFNIYFSDGWNPTKTGINCCYAGIYALPDDYEPESEFKPYYEEFEIDGDGFFCIKKGSDRIFYAWYNWQKFLDENDKYNGFGGWLFGLKLWSTKLLVTDMAKRELFESATKDIAVMPVCPTRIRFWRYKE